MKIQMLRIRRAETDRLALTEQGIEGEKPHAPERAVTLLSASLREALDAGAYKEGLCVARWYENITLRDLPALRAGQKLRFREAELEITRAGKDCFPECALVRENRICPLSREAAFARILTPGTVMKGEEVRVVP